MVIIPSIYLLVFVQLLQRLPNIVVHRDFKKFRNDLFRLELDNELIKHDINNIEYDHFINIFTETLSKHAPLKKKIR